MLLLVFRLSHKANKKSLYILEHYCTIYTNIVTLLSVVDYAKLHQHHRPTKATEQTVT